MKWVSSNVLKKIESQLFLVKKIYNIRKLPSIDPFAVALAFLKWRMKWQMMPYPLLLPKCFFFFLISSFSFP